MFKQLPIVHAPPIPLPAPCWLALFLEGSHAQCAKLITSLSFSYSSRNILSQITWPEWNSGCATLCINIKRSKIAQVWNFIHRDCTEIQPPYKTPPGIQQPRQINKYMFCTRFPYFVKSSMPRLNAILIHGPSSRSWETFIYKFDVTYSVQLSKNIAIHRIKNYPAVECSKDVPRYPPNKINPVYSFIRPTKTPDEVSILLPWKCFCRSLFKILVASNPALSHSCLGMISRARAMDPIRSCSFPAIDREKSLRYLLSSISIAPPPATTASFLIARRTIMMASCRDLSVSSMNCSAPPRKMTVHVLASGQPVKMLYLKYE